MQNLGGLIIAFGYMVAMIGVGAYTTKWIRSGDDFLMSGRELGWPVLAGSLAAMQLAGTTIAGYPGTAYAKGWGNLWGAWGWVISGAVYLLLFAKYSRRTGAFTTVEWFEAKFDKTNRTILAIGTIIALLFGGMGQFVGSARILSAWLNVSYITGVLIIGIATIIYMVIGGFWASMITDYVQFILAAIVIYLILPIFVLVSFGDLSFLTPGASAVPVELLEFPFGTMDVFGWIFPASVIAMIANNFSFMLSNSYYWNKCVAARSDKASAKGWIISLIFVVPFGIVTTIVGLYIRATYPDVQVTDQVFGILMTEMPVVLSGFVMMAVLAATQSTANGIILGCSTIISRDILSRIFPKANLLKVSQWSTLGVGVTCMLLAIFFTEGALHGLALMGAFIVPALPPLIASVLWPRKATKEGSAVGMGVSIAFGLYWHFGTELSKTVAHTMFVTFALSFVLMLLVDLIVNKFTGPWWKTKREKRREEWQAQAKGLQTANIVAEEAKPAQRMSFEELYCETAKPLIVIKPFVRCIEKIAKTMHPEYQSILKR